MKDSIHWFNGRTDNERERKGAELQRFIYIHIIVEFLGWYTCWNQFQI